MTGYAVWRDTVVVPSRTVGKQKADGISKTRSHNLPSSDPGHREAHRWRKS